MKITLAETSLIKLRENSSLDVKLRIFIYLNTSKSYLHSSFHSLYDYHIVMVLFLMRASLIKLMD